MTLWGWIAMTPLALALLAALRHRSWVRFVLVAAVTALVALWLVRRHSDASERIILIVDDPAALSRLGAMWSNHGRELDVASCAGVVLDDRTAPGDIALRWYGRCDELRPAGVVAVRTPSEALHLAAGAGRAAPRNLEWIIGRRTRVIFLITSPASWTRRDWNIAVPDEVAALRGAGVLVDVVHADGRGERTGPPVLSILPRRSFIPSTGAGTESFTFDLELAGVAAPSFERRCVLGGDCLEDGDCRSGGRCAAGVCRAAGTTAAVTPTPTFPPWTLAGATTKAIPSPRDPNSWMTAAPISLTELDRHGSSSTLREGWHSLRCRVRTPGPAATAVIADATVYIPVRRAEVVFVQGAARQFRLDPGKLSTAEEEEALRRALDAQVITQTKSVDATVSLGLPYREDEREVDSPPPECSGARVRGQLCHERPRMLVIHDATAAFWTRNCPWIVDQVAAGMNLIVSGVPRDVPACAALPVYALTTEDTDETKRENLRFDRVPRVSFVFDPSRVGHLTYKPTPTGAVEGIPPVAADDGLVAQRLIAEQVAAAVGWRFAGGRFEPAKRDPLGRRPFYQLEFADFGLPWPQFEVSLDSNSASQMAADSHVGTRLANWAKLDKQPRWRVGINDMVVVFAYDIAQPAMGSPAVAALLARGARVIVIPIRTPFAGAFSGAPLAQDIGGNLKPRPDGPFAAANANLERRLTYLGPGGFTATPASAIDLAGGSQAAAAAVARRLVEEVQRQGRGTRMRVQVLSMGRFIDERVLPPGGVVVPGAPAITTGGGPLRFQQLAVRPGASAMPLLEIADDRSLHTLLASHLDPIRIAYGAMVGRGHVLFLGYSIVEGTLGDFRFDVPWRDDPDARLVAPGRPDMWGPRRILDLGWLTSRIEPLPTLRPEVVAAEVVGGRGLRFTVRQRIQSRTTFDRMFAQTYAGAVRCTEGDPLELLQIRALRPDQHEIEYELSLSSWDRICPATGCLVALCRQSCYGATCTRPVESGETVYLTSPPRAVEQVTDELDALEQLSLLARYAGGGASGPLKRLRRSLRPVALLGVTFLLAVLWIRRALGRALWVRRVVSAARRPPRDDVLDTRGYLREVGEALGMPTADVSVGASAGNRPFDPGDKLRAVIRQDVLVMMGLAGPDQTAAARVVRRIDERTRKVRMIVNVGRSMRLPAGGNAKLLAAAAICDAMAELTWSVRGQVELQLVGARHAAPDVAAGGPAPSAVLAPAALGRAAGGAVAMSASQAEPGETVIYVSDFLDEDLDELRRVCAELEAEGCPVGLVRVFSPAEWLLTEFGVHPATGTVLDRTDWTVADLRRAYDELGLHLDARFDDLPGGVLHVSSAHDVQDLITLLKESRLLPLLR